MKTKKGWNQSGKDLSAYLQIGDQVDEDLWYYFLEVLPPIFLPGILQISEPVSHVNGRPTYSTLKKLGEQWFYCGHCHRGQIYEPKENSLHSAERNKAMKILSSRTGDGYHEYQIMSGAETVATVHDLGHNRVRETFERANLFAGAKELLHACKSMLVAVDESRELPAGHPGHSTYLHTVAIPRIKDAIAKAEKGEV